MTRRRPFASVVQLLLVILMSLSFFLLGQRIDILLYQIGLILMVVTALSQIAFGNIDPKANFGKSMIMYAFYMAIVVVVFQISVWLIPTLIGLGR